MIRRLPASTSPLHHISLLFLLLLHLTSGQSTGCDICAQSNGQNCNTAYHNSPGQFCGYFHTSTSGSWNANGNQKPCCCPVNSSCDKVSLWRDKCMCLPLDNGGGSHHHHRYDDGYDDITMGGFLRLIGVIVFFCICCGICGTICPSNTRRHGSLEEGQSFIPVAVPAGGYNGGEPSAPPPTAPGWTPPPQSRNSGGVGSGIGPALGGFAVGSLMSRMFSGGGGRHHHGRHRHHHSGGGGAFAGDTGSGGGGGGGGFGAFAGDTGGGGGAFAGDS